MRQNLLACYTELIDILKQMAITHVSEHCRIMGFSYPTFHFQNSISEIPFSVLVTHMLLRIIIKG